MNDVTNHSTANPGISTATYAMYVHKAMTITEINTKLFQSNQFNQYLIVGDIYSHEKIWMSSYGVFHGCKRGKCVA